MKAIGDQFKFNMELSDTIEYDRISQDPLLGKVFLLGQRNPGESKPDVLMSSKSHNGQRLAGCPSLVEGVVISNFAFSIF